MTRIRALLAALVMAAVVAAAMAPAVVAHSELKSSVPADGSTVSGTPTTITATFDEPFVVSKSSLALQTEAGATVATGKAANGSQATVMRISPVPALEPGRYLLLWKTVALDGDAANGTVLFTVAAAGSPSPSPSPAESPSPAASPSPVASVSIAPSAQPSVGPSPSPAPSPAPASGDSTPLLLGIVAVVVLLGAAGLALSRRRAGP